MKIWPVNIGISVDSDSPDTGRVGTALKLLARSVAYSFSLSVQLLIILAHFANPHANPPLL
jgi:predicted anti-sigma-YlaC factor YlaD